MVNEYQNFLLHGSYPVPDYKGIGSLKFNFFPKSIRWIMQLSPAFLISGYKVKVLKEPQEFYKELLERSSKATSRISFSSLYLGTNKLESNLVSIIKEKLIVCDSLDVLWLLDYTRGTRGSINSATLLKSLVAVSPLKCEVSFYHTPRLRGFLKWLIPQRWNEIIGLQHMKLYIFDDSFIISGANLSNDYFTNRQDRYILFDNCPELADFYDRLLHTISKYSFQLKSDGSMKMHTDIHVHPYLGNYLEYTSALRNSVQDLWEAEIIRSQKHIKSMEYFRSSSSLDTLVCPTVQMGQFGITNDSAVTSVLLKTADKDNKIFLASGYFNLTDTYIKCIISESTAKFDIVCAHPKANGFLGSKGFSGAIPAGYTQIAKQFYKKLILGNQSDRISLFEYRRPGWTFHAKGLWCLSNSETVPYITAIGSPNFGYRSTDRDLESQVIIFTSNNELKEQLHEEYSRLYLQSEKVNDDTFLQTDRQIPLWVKLIMPIIKIFF